MRIVRVLLVLALWLPLLGALDGGAASALALQESAVHPLSDNVAIRPNDKTVRVGETFTVDVKIEGGDAVVSSDVQITFDTTYLEVTRVTHSGVFDSYYFDNSNLAAGVIWFGGGTFNTKTPPFTFVTLSVRAKTLTGTTKLVFNPTETLVEGVAGSVRGSLIDGTIRIQAEPTGTPTSTRTATSTVTLTPTPSLYAHNHENANADRHTYSHADTDRYANTHRYADAEPHPHDHEYANADQYTHNHVDTHPDGDFDAHADSHPYADASAWEILRAGL